MNNVSLLQCFQVYKFYQEGSLHVEVLRNITFTLKQGEMVAILGSSGSGKSTLLHLLGGLDFPTSGQIIFEGKKISSLSSSERALLRNQKIGFVYQSHHLLQDFTVLENVAMPLLIGKMSSKKAQKRAKTILETVGLEQYHYRYPTSLSGGERQRIAIARAIVNHPSLVLADEPTGNLDQINAEKIFNLLQELNRRYYTAFLIVTHDSQLANRLDRKMEMRYGSLLEIAS